MRGCFHPHRRHEPRCGVLPAYAGMFLAVTQQPILDFSSPRVCGDVSTSSVPLLVDIRFSPRMRGCFCQVAAKERPGQVLPAYAGMFLSERSERTDFDCSPRVCGDVSTGMSCKMYQNEFSPRMRGCFSAIPALDQPFLVLPAYAGMFLTGQFQGGDGLSSPRVCGDVSGSNWKTRRKIPFSPRMRGCF